MSDLKSKHQNLVKEYEGVCKKLHDLKEENKKLRQENTQLKQQVLQEEEFDFVEIDPEEYNLDDNKTLDLDLFDNPEDDIWELEDETYEDTEYYYYPQQEVEQW
jgi:regulator of replication initiation timing